MSTSDRLSVQIELNNDIVQLKFLRDTGLGMILIDADVDDFTQDDSDEFVTIINTRIVELGGTI